MLLKGGNVCAAVICCDTNLKGWDYIVEAPEDQILQLDSKIRQQYVNEAIEHLNDSYSRLIRHPSSLIGKLISCAPAQSSKQPEFKQLLANVQANGAFYEDSLRNWIPINRTACPEMLKALNGHIIAGNQDMALVLLESGMPFSAETLMLACSHKRTEVALNLIENRHAVNIMKNLDCLPIFEVAMENELSSVIQAMLKDLKDPVRFLNKVMASGNEGLAVYLVENGITFKSENLLNACEYGRLSDLAGSLISMGADINIRDKYGRSLIYLSCQRDSHKLFVELIKRGASLTKEEVERFFQMMAPSKFDEDGRVELAKACLNVHEQFTRANLHKLEIKDKAKLAELEKVVDV